MQQVTTTKTKAKQSVLVAVFVVNTLKLGCTIIHQLHTFYLITRDSYTYDNMCVMSDGCDVGLCRQRSQTKQAVKPKVQHKGFCLMAMNRLAKVEVSAPTEGLSHYVVHICKPTYSHVRVHIYTKTKQTVTHHQGKKKFDFSSLTI